MEEIYQNIFYFTDKTATRQTEKDAVLKEIPTTHANIFNPAYF